MENRLPPEFKTNEKILMRFAVLGWIAAVCIQTFACQTDPPPTALLQVTVLQEKDEVPAKGARITLYSNMLDWQSETNPINATAFTNSQGNFIFSQLPFEKVYLDIKSTELTQDNWESKVEIQLITARFGYNNRVYSILKPSFSGRFSQAKGKVWRLSKVLDQKQDITALYEPCLLDNTLKALKNNTIVLYEGHLKCDDVALDSLNGIWSRNAQHLIFDFGGMKQIYNVLYFSNDSLILQTRWQDRIADLYYLSQ